MQVSEERKAEIRAATIRAREILQPGDRLFISRCGGIRTTVTFVGFDDPPYHSWIRSKTLDDIAAVNIMKVNGKPVDFTKENPWL